MNTNNAKPTFYLETMGCQMNKLDSELVIDLLTRHGYHPSDDPAQAQIILFNTCSVRQHAEDKVISKIGQLRSRHRLQSDLVIAVIGCMAQRLGQQLIDEHPEVDLVCGPGQIYQIPQLLEQIQNSHRKQHALSLNDPSQWASLEQLDSSRSASSAQNSFQTYLRVMRGCNHYCSYCIVPYVRGPEYSRPPENILEEARRLIDAGIVEITLLGQTVNNYHYTENGQSLDLADILEKVHDLPGLKRLRFVTSHPQNFSPRIFHAMAEKPNICPYLHLPAQSGSDSILKKMNRKYTIAQYIDLIDQARSITDDLAVAGDFIVGFPGETEQDFLDTAALIERIRYKNCFIFRYSPRPNTHAEKKYPDDVTPEAKQYRNQYLLDLQNKISHEDNQRFVNQTVEILVEGLSKKPHLNASADGTPASASLPQLTGRTTGDHIVVFNGPESLIGQIIKVRIQKASSLTLFGLYS